MKFLFAVLISLFSVNAFAFELTSAKYICTHSANDYVRRIEISYDGKAAETPQNTAPCKVTYYKDSEDIPPQVLFNADGQAGYCEEKTAWFLSERLMGKYGWKCEANSAPVAKKAADTPKKAANTTK